MTAAEVRVLTEVGAGGRAFDRVVFTRNVRVMVSVGDGGRTLRLHERFRDAPADVLRSIGAMYGRGGRRMAGTGRAAVRDYLRGLPAPGPTAGEDSSGIPRGRRRSLPADQRHIDRLRREFEATNAAHFDGALPAVPISLSGRMKRRNGHFSPAPLEIVISRRLCVEAEPGEAEMTLRHEMIHLWQHVSGRKLGHGREFRLLAARLDVHPRATRPVCWSAGAGSDARTSRKP